MKSRLLRLLPGPSAAIRSTLPTVTVYQPSLCLRLQKRFITAEEKPPPEADKPGLGPNQEQLPDVSEEAAATGKIMGDEGPDIEQGTPVQEVRPSRLGSINVVLLMLICIDIETRAKPG